MFDNNPLEKDIRVQKKIKELKESRNKKSFEKLIKIKGFKPKEDFNKTDLYVFDDLYYKKGRFALDDEPLNTFKNTFNMFAVFYRRFFDIIFKRLCAGGL